MSPNQDDSDRIYRRAQGDSRCQTISASARPSRKPNSRCQLLDAKASPFHRGLTPIQCIQYALDKPGVLTVLPGIRGMADLQDVLAFLDAMPEQRDYSIIGEFAPPEAEGICVYCNHCQPCPEGISIVLANKYYDLARLGDEMAAEHYRNLEKYTEDCVQRGHCNARCLFGVDQMTRMCEMTAYFGK